MSSLFPRLAAAVILWPLAAAAQAPTAPSATAPAQSAAASAPASTATVGKRDTHFVTTLAEGGMAEIQFSQLAVKQSQNADVKSFAQKMVDEHTKAGDQLGQIATKDSITTPTTLSKRHQTLYSRLGSLNGAAFDKQYLRVMVSDHDNAIKALKSEIKSGKDQEIVGFAKTVLPTVQEHDQMVHDLQGKVVSQ